MCRTTTQNFCRNEYNVTGFCSKQSCPLANSRYATVREHEGLSAIFVSCQSESHRTTLQVYYTYTSRRSSVRIRRRTCGKRFSCRITTRRLLSRCAHYSVGNICRLLTRQTQIDKELVHWPNFMIHKCKQRITKITQYLIKMRRLRLRQEYVLNMFLASSSINMMYS